MLNAIFWMAIGIGLFVKFKPSLGFEGGRFYVGYTSWTGQPKKWFPLNP